MKLVIEIIDRNHNLALIAAARSLRLHTWRERRNGIACRVVEIADAQQAYLFGGEQMKRWRARLEMLYG